MCSRQCRQAKQRTSNRQIRLFYKGTKFILCISQFHSLAYQYQRTFGLIYQFSCNHNRLFIHIRNRNITADKIELRRHIFRCFDLSILCKIQHYRSRTSALCYIESPSYRPSHIFGPANLIAPLCYRLRNTHQINFLKSICTKESRTNLTGNNHQWSTVNHSICNTCYRIGSTGPARYQTNSDFTGNPCKSLCCMRSSLLMANQYMVHPVLMIK